MERQLGSVSHYESQRFRNAVAHIVNNPLVSCDETIEKTIHRFYASEPYNSPVYPFQTVKEIIKDYLEVIADSAANGEGTVDNKSDDDWVNHFTL